MKAPIIFIGIICLFYQQSTAQNVGIGSINPQNKLEVRGNLLVTQEYTQTQAQPTAAQTKAMLHSGTITFTENDSTGYIYDPGGNAGNYAASADATASIGLNYSCIGFELDFTDIDLGIGDTIIVIDDEGTSPLPWFTAGNIRNAMQKITISGMRVDILFKSDNDASTGRGFVLKFKRLYANNSNPGNVKSFAGNSLAFNSSLGSLQLGRHESWLPGYFSFAGGNLSRATGDNAMAFGDANTASGDYSTSLGYSNISAGTGSVTFGGNNTAAGVYSSALGSMNHAQGSSSVAAGYNNLASGINSIAMGYNAQATNNYAVAIGNNVAAGGAGSMAIGNYVSTSSYTGTLVMGDNSTTTMLTSGGNNTFRSRFVGGYALFTGLAPSAGAVLPAGSNSWGTISDVRLKENFLPVNGEKVLAAISTMPLSTWNYIGQDKKIFRHYGPMAQDFYKAFGHDEIGEIGCDTLINQHDLIGVNMVAIQALEKRTAVQREQIKQLSAETQVLIKENAKLAAMLEQTISRKRKNFKPKASWQTGQLFVTVPL